MEGNKHGKTKINITQYALVAYHHLFGCGSDISRSKYVHYRPDCKGGEFVGAAVESNTKKGFSGEIKVIVGFDKEGKLLNYSVLQHAETPGLGAKMQEWFSTDKNKQSVLGRSLSAGPLKVTKDGGNVDAITAATITSRAFLDAVNRAYSAFAGTDGVTGATTANTNEGGNDNE